MARILLIDDDPTEIRMYQKSLSLAGFEVDVALDAEKGLELLRANPSDLILLDVMMPQKDGNATLDEIKREPALSKIPIIMLTNLPGDYFKEQALSHGAVKYVVKSNTSREDLIATINDVLSVYAKQKST